MGMVCFKSWMLDMHCTAFKVAVSEDTLSMKCLFFFPARTPNASKL
jgi:hypothetical protein